jgi:hypothetical protein
VRQESGIVNEDEGEKSVAHLSDDDSSTSSTRLTNLALELTSKVVLDLVSVL